MTFAEFVGQNWSQKSITFKSLAAAIAAFRESGLCAHPTTCCGECTECGHVLSVEGTFKVNPDKSRYLDARRS